MSRDKQIEEMARYCCYPCDLYDEGNEGKDCTYCDYKTCLCAEAAKALYNAGYRKKSDVVEEILDCLRGIYDYWRSDDCIRESSAIILAIAELKKKLESEGEG